MTDDLQLLRTYKTYDEAVRMLTKRFFSMTNQPTGKQQ